MTAWKNGMPDGYGYNRYGESPYYHPEEHGLKILTVHDWAGSWEFDMIVVWQDPTTLLMYAAYDSGCSCPTPFGDLTREGMLPITDPDDLYKLLSDNYNEDRREDPDFKQIQMTVHRALLEAEQLA